MLQVEETMSRGRQNQRTAYSLATSQHGIVARRQLLERRFSASLVSYWMTSGRLVRVFPGIYALGRPAVTDESLWMAAALAGGRAAVIAGRAAAAVWGFGDPPPVIDVIRAEGPQRLIHGSPPHSKTSVRMRRAGLRPYESQRIGPLPVATTDRILADLAGELSDPDLRRYFIEAGRTGRLTSGCLSRIAACDRRYKGRSRLRHLVDAWDPTKGRIRSVLEGEFRLMCAEQGLPAPLTNQKIGRYEVDCLWVDAKLVVELDGRRFHGDVFALELDSAKSRALRAMGYRVLRFTWNEVIGFPEEVARQIRRALGSSKDR